MKFFGGAIFSSTILFLQIITAKSLNSSYLFENIDEFSKNEERTGDLLRVTTRPYEPFIMYQDDQFYKGIDYKIIEIIAEQFEKEHLDISIRTGDQLHSLNIGQPLPK